MRLSIIILLFFAPLLSTSQNTKSDSMQKINYQKALNYLSDSDYIKAHLNFLYAHARNKKSYLGKLSLKKRDALEPIVISLKLALKEKMLKKIQGTWEMKKNGSNWGFENVDDDSPFKNTMTIKGYKVLFFKNDSLLKTANIEKTSYFNKIIDSENKTWNYTLNEESTMHLIESIGVCGNMEIYYERIK